MNKRKAKKKYKAIYEKRLNERVVFLNLDAINPKDKVITFLIRSRGYNYEADVIVDTIEVSPSVHGCLPVDIHGAIIESRARHE